MRMGISFDAVDDYVYIPASSSLVSDDWTIIARFYCINITGATQNVFSQYGTTAGNPHRGIRLDASGRVGFHVRDDAGHLATLFYDVMLNQWIFAILKKSGNTVIFSINNVEKYSGTGFTTVTTNKHAFLGSLADSSPYELLNGFIDEVYIYNKSLSPKETQLLMKGIPIYDGLVLHFDFERERASEGTDRVRDLSPYGNHGTIYGGARQVPIPDFPPLYKRRL
jgi:hypothetical protein